LVKNHRCCEVEPMRIFSGFRCELSRSHPIEKLKPFTELRVAEDNYHRALMELDKSIRALDQNGVHPNAAMAASMNERIRSQRDRVERYFRDYEDKFNSLGLKNP